ncbi:putative F-box/LRR-repeat protein 23 [Rosa sericea]
MNRNQEQNCRNWIDLPHDLTASILSRLGAIEILETAQKVCMTWRRICKDPMMWRTIDMCGVWVWGNSKSWKKNARKMAAMCRHAVDLGRGNVVDISLQNFGTNCLLMDITNSCKGIRRLRLVLPNIMHNGLIRVASKLPLLEGLEISYSAYTTGGLEAIGRCCPLLKSLKLNKRHDIRYDWDGLLLAELHHHYQVFGSKSSSGVIHDDGDALAIAGTMHGLQQLQIFGNKVTNKGLLAILDGCPCLESLDLRRCFNLKVEGDLKRRCFQGIKQLRLPDDSTDDYELVATDEIVYKLYQSFYSRLVR